MSSASPASASGPSTPEISATAPASATLRDKLLQPGSAEPAAPAIGGIAALAPRAPASDFAEPTWQALAAQHRYDRAMDAAEAQGLDAICATAEIAELMSLGDAARFARRLDAAQLIFRDVRERFPDDERASLAAFYLGRIAFDERASYANAAAWFSTYLAERPHGALAREASGRLVEAFERAGNHEGARHAAFRYLQAFPDGPHAALARSLVR